MNKTVVLNVVGLTPSLIGAGTPHLRAFRDGGRTAPIEPGLPAVTCSSQADFLTGVRPGEHGVVGNGWYFRETDEVRLWQQSAALVQRPRVWDLAKGRDARFTCANLFWWHAMYSSADVTVTPRPMYAADGRKVPDVWTDPPALRDELQAELGRFPLFKFWGPFAGIESSDWIGRAAVRVDERFDPTLTLIYLPHLDYALQRSGPAGPEAAAAASEIDAVVGRLIEYYKCKNTTIIILSEYGIEPVSTPVHLNRVLREAGFLSTRLELGRERLDAGASRAFAVADHQVVHVYVQNAADLPAVSGLLAKTAGVERVLDADGKRAAGLDHPRAGELVAVAEPGCWFTYYYWLDDAVAPDYARTVDIHRKPGYDPCELFVDPSRRLARPRLMGKLLARKAGFRALLDPVPLDATLVRGSHGRATSGEGGPLVMTDAGSLAGERMEGTGVRDLILRTLFG